LQNLGFKNVKKLGDFGFGGEDVADLYYYPQKEAKVWNMIDVAVDKILTQLSK